MDINRNAPVITRDEIVIAAPLSTVWSLLTDIAAWPEWQQDVNRASLEGPLSRKAASVAPTLCIRT